MTAHRNPRLPRLPHLAHLPRPARIALACLAALLAGCAAPRTQVVLLPQADGSASAVVLRAGQAQQVLDQPYQRASIAQRGDASFRVDHTDAAAVRAAYPELFALQPAPAKVFTLYFATGGASLEPSSEAELAAALQGALAEPGSSIVVVGHTDTRGDPASNDALSLQRAAEVRQLLVARGFPAERIEAAGRGARDLAVPTGPQVDEARNRRVTLEIR